jgi:hypothetical protein
MFFTFPLGFMIISATEEFCADAKLGSAGAGACTGAGNAAGANEERGTCK